MPGRSRKPGAETRAASPTSAKAKRKSATDKQDAGSRKPAQSAVATVTRDLLQNVKHGSQRAEFDDRLPIDCGREIVMHKRMASAFHETNPASLLMWHRVDTIIVTDGST